MPVLIAGNGLTVIDRVPAYGDEWLPEPEDGLTDRIREMRRRAGEAGRNIKVTVYGATPADAAMYAGAGAHRVVYWLPLRARERTIARVEELAAAIR